MANTPLRFLIVDDHAPARIALREMVAAQPGWHVIDEATNGLEAISSAITNRPDVVLMDVAMPKLNGLQTARKIKANFPQVKIILFSAYADRGYSHGSKEAGADFFVQKEELTAQALCKIVTQVLSNGLSAN